MPKTPEGFVLDAILDYLQAKRILAFRMNVGTARMGSRFVQFGVPGMADILAFGPAESYVQPVIVMWIECKAPKGKQSELQKSFQHLVEENGHRYIIARSIEDVEAAL